MAAYPWLRAGIGAVFGLCLGSFLNVLIWRLPQRLSLVRPASSCPECGEPLRRRDLIPVFSWLMLRGCCRSCQVWISARYPLVEAVTAVVGAALAWRFADVPTIAAFLAVAGGCIALSAIDIDTHTLPTRLVYATGILGATLLAVASALNGRAQRLLPAVTAAIVVGLVLYAVWALVPGGFGFGDVRLGAMLALFLGWLSAAHVFVGVALAFVLGAVVGLGLIVGGRAGRRTAVPFGPFLAAGALISVLFGHSIIRWWLPAV